MSDKIKSYKLSPQLKAEIGQARRRIEREFPISIDFSFFKRIKLPWKTIGGIALAFVIIIAAYVGIKKTYEVVVEKQRQNQLAREEEYRQRLESIKTEVASKGTDAYSYVLLSQEYLKQGDGDRAIAAAEIAVERDSKWRDGYVNLGQIYLSTDRFGEARISFEKALAIDPTCGRCHYLQSLVYAELKNPEAAKQEFAKAKQFGFESEIGG
ncbi:MAG: tetratricopeptide repeat protein [Candidatus Berkelbacteria bacterium]|nr:tetratricopeptide repeat protein [Candidatus Berkelbacteria bacterium]